MNVKLTFANFNTRNKSEQSFKGFSHLSRSSLIMEKGTNVNRIFIRRVFKKFWNFLADRLL